MKSSKLIFPALTCASAISVSAALHAADFDDLINIDPTGGSTSTVLNLNGAQKWSVESDSDFLIRRGSVIPFLLDQFAGPGAIYVDSDGDTALGTITPINDFNSRLHIEDPTPDIAFKTIPTPDPNAPGGIRDQTWSLFANDVGFGICDETTYSQSEGSVPCVPFFVQTGSPVDSLVVRDSGFVGLGIINPEEKLHVRDGNLKVEQTTPGDTALLNFATASSNWEIKQNGNTGRLTFFSPGGGAVSASFKFDRQAQENLLRVGVLAGDTVDINGKLLINGGEVTPDYVFEPSYELETIEEHADFMFTNKHLPALPGAAANEKGVDIVSHHYGALEELEKAHIYISQLNDEIKQLKNEYENRISQLEAALSEANE